MRIRTLSLINNLPIFVLLLMVKLFYSCTHSHSMEYKYDSILNPQIQQQKSWFQFSSEAQKNQNILVNEIGGKVSISGLEFSDGAFVNAKEREMFYLKSVYQRSTPPYAGAVAAKEECPAEFLPFIFDETNDSGQRSFGFVARGTEREKYGACDGKTGQITFMKVLIECTSVKKLYDIELTVSDASIAYKKMEEVFTGFQCKKTEL